MATKQILVVAASLFISTPFLADAQVVGIKEPFANVGVKLGGNFQQLSGAAVTSGPGVVGGVYADKSLGRLSVRAEVLGSFTGYTTKYPAAAYAVHTSGMDTITKGEFTAINISVPLLATYKITRSLQVLAGPQFSYVAALSDKNGAYTGIYGDNSFIAGTDLAVVAGLELRVAKRVTFGARFIKGLTNVNKSTYSATPETWTTTGLQATISYKLL